MRGRLVGAHGKRPCARNARGTYTCTVKYAGGTRTILWNPTRKVTMRMPGAVSTEDQRGRSAPRSGSPTRLKVGYRPVMVTSR